MSDAKRGRYAAYVVVLLAITAAFSYMDRLALVVLAPDIKAELGLSDTQLGLLVGLAFALFYGICGVPIAWLADRSIRKNIIATSLMVWSAMTALSGAAQGYLLLLLARMGVGVGEAGCMPPSNSLICDYVPPKGRPVAFTVYQFGPTLGTLLGLALTGWLGSMFGWRMTFLILGAPGILWALLIFFTLREPKRGVFDPPGSADAQAQSIFAMLKTLAGVKTLRWIILYACASGFAALGLLSWWPSYYQRYLGASLAETGASLGFTIGGAQILGLFAGAFLFARVAKGSRATSIYIGAVAAALMVPLTLVVNAISSATVATACISLWAFLQILPTGAIWTALAESVPPSLRASASSMQILLTSIIGFGGGPTLVGILSDQVGLRAALLAPALVLALAPAALWVVAHRVQGEERRARLNLAAAPATT